MNPIFYAVRTIEGVMAWGLSVTDARRLCRKLSQKGVRSKMFAY